MFISVCDNSYCKVRQIILLQSLMDSCLKLQQLPGGLVLANKGIVNKKKIITVNSREFLSMLN